MRTLSIVCDACGTINRINQRYCLNCKQPLAQPGNGAMLTPIPSVYPPASRLLKQRYQLTQILGKGGMGTVYLAFDLQLGNRLVAIKEMSQSGLAPLERQIAAKSFQREAHFLAELQHPHLPGVHDHFEENQRCYLVMSFIKGQTLEEYLQAQNGKLAVAEAIEIGLVLCDILTYLHSHNPPIIFRDLKPSNIMRTVDGYIYLIDFGIARLFKPGQTKDTASRGSSGYAPPEQYGRAQTTPGSDLYSLGATLYQLLSGYELASTPFRQPPIQDLVPTLPAQLAVLITSMLDLDEKKRPSSAESVKRELQHIKLLDQAAKQRLQGATRVKQELSNISTNPDQQTLAPTVSQKRGMGLAIFTLILTVLVVLSSIVFVIFRLETAHSGSALLSTPTARGVTAPASTPEQVVQVFCDAMNGLYPDFPIAYQQLSSTYQSEHTLDNFEENFQETNRCSIVNALNAQHQATLQLTMTCPPPGMPGGPPPPPAGTVPPGGPPQKINPASLTLVEDGKRGWKIDKIDLTRQSCSVPPAT